MVNVPRLGFVRFVSWYKSSLIDGKSQGFFSTFFELGKLIACMVEMQRSDGNQRLLA